jgi:hypothetical protein
MQNMARAIIRTRAKLSHPKIGIDRAGSMSVLRVKSPDKKINLDIIIFSIKNL